MIDDSYEVSGRTPSPTPARRLVAAGIKRGNGQLVVEQPQMSAADKAAHAAASHVRRLQAIAHVEMAAALADGAGAPDYAAGYRADADRKRAEFETQGVAS